MFRLLSLPSALIFYSLQVAFLVVMLGIYLAVSAAKFEPQM